MPPHLSQRRYIVRSSIVAVMVVAPLFIAGLRFLEVAAARSLFWGYLVVLSVSLTVVVGSRMVLLRRFEQGLDHLRAEAWEEAITAFEDYLAFLQANPLFDEWHWLMMLTADAYTLTEMTLCNLGYAHAQAGRLGYAHAFYQRTLERNPENAVARAALAELESPTHA